MTDDRQTNDGAVAQKYLWTSLVVQWLRLCIPSTAGVGSVPGWVKSWMPNRLEKKKKKGFKD